MVVYNYLCVIRKSDFIDLFKFGHLQVNHAITFDGDIQSHSNDDYLFDLVTCKMNIFEYSFEYLLIHFTSDLYKGTSVNVQIQNVQGIYTFSQEAKKEMSISFDPRIQLHVSPWTDKFDRLQHDMFVEQSMRGIDNIWKIFELPTEDKIKCEQIINKEIVSEVFREVFSYERPKGDKSIWTYLLRYERHSIYPKDMKGFFCDTIHVFCNMKSQQELIGEVAEQTDLYSQLIECPKSEFVLLRTIALNSRLSQFTEELTGCRFVVAAPLFLFLKDMFKDGLNCKPSKQIIDYAKEVGDFECSLAAYMLGLTLGYDNTYDGYYESVNLPIFKKRLSDTKDSKQEFSVPISDSTSHECPLEIQSSEDQVEKNTAVPEENTAKESKQKKIVLTPDSPSDECPLETQSSEVQVEIDKVESEGMTADEPVLEYAKETTPTEAAPKKAEYTQLALSPEMKEPLAYLYKGRGSTYKRIVVYTEEELKYYIEKEHYKKYTHTPRSRK